MRDDAISFNQKIGNAIVTLNWEPYALSEDEDPIDATIYTGQSEMSQDHPHRLAILPCAIICGKQSLCIGAISKERIVVRNRNCLC